MSAAPLYGIYTKSLRSPLCELKPGWIIGYERVHAHYTTCRVRIAEMDRKPQNEQLLFQKILKDPQAKISHVFVDLQKVWSGKSLKSHSSKQPFPAGLVMAHANWVLGIKAKVDLLHSKGLWAHTCVTAAAGGEPPANISLTR